MTAAWWLWEIVQLWGSTGFRESHLHLPTEQIPLLAALTAALQHDATARSPNCWILKWNAALPLIYYPPASGVRPTQTPPRDGQADRLGDEAGRRGLWGICF